MWMQQDSDDDDEEEEEENDEKSKNMPVLFHIMERRRDAFSKGLQKKKKAVVQVTEPEGKAIFCLSADMKCRKMLYKLVKDDRFDAFIIIVILISTASLCF